MVAVGGQSDASAAETAAALVRDPRRQRLLVAGAAAALAVVFVAALAPLWPALHSQWINVSTYSHGYLLAAMAAWLVWWGWRTRPPSLVTADWRFLPVLAGVLGALALMEVLFLNVPRLFLVPPLIVACAGLGFGREAALRTLGPAMLLYFALPVWEAINWILQSMTTAAVTPALATTGVPVFIEGNFVTIPAGRFEIAEGCSGLKYLITALSLASFYALAFLPGWRRRALLITAAAGLAILSNWVRVYSVILVGHLSEMQSGLVDDHKAFGWIVFIVFLLPVMWLARRLEAQPPREASSESEAPHRGSVRTVAVVAGVVVASVLLAGTRAGIASMSSPAAGARVGVPELADGGAFQPAGASPWQPVFANAVESRAAAAGVTPSVEVYRAVYPWQDREHRLIAYGNTFVPERWQPVAQRRIAVPAADAALEVQELEGHLARGRRLVWGWYWVAGEPAAGALEAKLLELKGLLSGRRDAMAAAVSTECELDDCEAARARLGEFLESSVQCLRWTP